MVRSRFLWCLWARLPDIHADPLKLILRHQESVDSEHAHNFYIVYIEPPRRGGSRIINMD